MPNIQDVAKAAKVSVATVSRVINGIGAVSPDTAKRVNQMIEKMGYRPNLLGRNLRRMKTGMVLIMLPSILNTFYSKVVKGIEDKAHEHGFNPIICTTGDNPERERLFFNMVRDRQADGIICMSSSLKISEINRFARAFPIVQLCEYNEAVSAPSISIDNFQAAKDAVNHLIGYGHKKIGLLSNDNDYVSSRLREQGYIEALKDAGLNFKMIDYGNYTYQSGYKAAVRLYEKGATAIFAISDYMAIGAARAAQDLGLAIPNQAAIVGFDNINISYMFSPEITTVAQPQYEMGIKAMEMILERIDNKTVNSEKIFLPHSLVVRESTAGK